MREAISKQFGIRMNSRIGAWRGCAIPGAPVMPGVLVIEALAQCGAILALREIENRDQKLVLFTGIKEARFRRPVVPGDTLVLEVTALRTGSRIQRMRGEAKVDGQICADAELTSVIADRES